MILVKKSSILPGSFDHPHYFLPDKAIAALVYISSWLSTVAWRNNVKDWTSTVLVSPAELTCVVLGGGQPLLQAAAVDNSDLMGTCHFVETIISWLTDPEQLQGDKSDSMKSPSWQIRQNTPEVCFGETWRLAVRVIFREFEMGSFWGEEWLTFCEEDWWSAGSFWGEEWWTGSSMIFSQRAALLEIRSIPQVGLLSEMVFIFN